MTAVEYRQQGLAYRQQGQLEAAIEAFEAAVALEPDNLSGRVILGWTLHLAQQRDAATQVLRQNLGQDAYHEPSLNALGIVHLVSDRLWAAVVTHGRAVLISQDNEIAHYNLSLALQRLGFACWAIAAAERAIELEPYNPHPFVAQAIAYWSQGDQEAAFAIYQEAAALDSRYWDGYFLGYLDEAGFSPEQIEQSREIANLR
jgi:tetratricopeptide (TPR) repeat protein